MANIIKAVMGAGVFSLPWAVAQGGIVFVPAFIMAAAALALHTLSMLVAAKRKILQLRPDAAAQVRRGRRSAARRRANAAASRSRFRATPALWRRLWAPSAAAPRRCVLAAAFLDAAISLTMQRISSADDEFGVLLRHLQRIPCVRCLYAGHHSASGVSTCDAMRRVALG